MTEERTSDGARETPEVEGITTPDRPHHPHRRHGPVLPRGAAPQDRGGRWSALVAVVIFVAGVLMFTRSGGSPAASAEADPQVPRPPRDWLRRFNDRGWRAVLIVPILLLGGLASWLGFADGVRSTVSLSSKALGLTYLVVGVVSLGAALTLAFQLARALWARAALLGGASAAYIGLSLGYRIVHHSVGWCLVLCVLGVISLGAAIIGGYDIATSKADAFGTPLKVLAGGLGVAIAAANLWYTAIYQPESASAGINVTGKVGAQHVDRHGIDLVPISITVVNDSSYELVVLELWAELRATYYTPRTGVRAPRKGVPANPRAFSADFEVGRWLETPYYIPPNASTSALFVLPIEGGPSWESFRLSQYFAYARASERGFDGLRRDTSATNTLRTDFKMSTIHNCYSKWAIVYRLHQSSLQVFTQGRQVLVTDVCPATKKHYTYLIAEVVSKSRAAIKELRDPRDARITRGSREGEFIAQPPARNAADTVR